MNILNNRHHAKPAHVLDEAEWALHTRLQLAAPQHTQHNLVTAEKFVPHIKGQQVSPVKEGWHHSPVQ